MEQLDRELAAREESIYTLTRQLEQHWAQPQDLLHNHQLKRLINNLERQLALLKNDNSCTLELLEQKVQTWVLALPN